MPDEMHSRDFEYCLGDNAAAGDASVRDKSSRRQLFNPDEERGDFE